MGVKKRVLTEKDIRKELAALEAKYGMTSAVFYEKFTRGELGDDRELLLWAGLCDMLASVGTRSTVPA